MIRFISLKNIALEMTSQMRSTLENCLDNKRNSFNLFSANVYMVKTMLSREIHLIRYPVDLPTKDNFKLVRVQIPEPKTGGF
jgi:hypothetical protein